MSIFQLTNITLLKNKNKIKNIPLLFLSRLSLSEDTINIQRGISRKKKKKICHRIISGANDFSTRAALVVEFVVAERPVFM